MKNYKVEIKSFKNCVHFYLNEQYLGMLVFDKGELSDFRAIIRKNRQSINKDNLYKTLRLSIFGLLNHYLKERELIENNVELEEIKSKIVQNSDVVLKETSKFIIENYLI